MRNLILISLFSIFLNYHLITAESTAENLALSNGTYTLNTKASTLEWIGKKVTGQHNGTINISQGELIVENDEIKTGNFAIDMSSIVDLDLNDPEWNKKLITHLKSEDFFSIENFPTAQFEITQVEPIATASENANYIVTGNLTIKGIIKEISFPAKLQHINQRIEATATITIDRTQWEIKYGSGKFVSGLGDRLIYDDINFKVKLVLSAK